MTQILIENAQDKEEISEKTEATIKECIEYTLKYEKCDFDAEVSVTFVDDEQIHSLNLSERAIDRPTDVLSFPFLEFDEKGNILDSDFDYNDGFLMLGDIVISAERAKAQAEEYGHSFLREMAFLTVHSMLHLLGYDHVDDEEGERIMFAKQEEILRNLNIKR